MGIEYRIAKDGEYPWALLLDATPSRTRVSAHLEAGTCYTATESGHVVGEFVLLPLDSATIELVNIAVSPGFRHKGYGSLLVQEAIRRAKDIGAKRVEVGTGNSSISQLAFYQKCGFRITGVDTDFFVTNYSERIEEDGIWCRDMIRLSMDLD